MEKTELPLGLGMALAQNEAAMQAFTAMSEPQRQAVLQRAHAVGSKGEMKQLVSGLAAQSSLSKAEQSR